MPYVNRKVTNLKERAQNLRGRGNKVEDPLPKR